MQSFVIYLFPVHKSDHGIFDVVNVLEARWRYALATLLRLKLHDDNRIDKW